MGNADDLDQRLKELRKWATSDIGSAMGIRMYDGIMELLAENIRELRKLNKHFEQKGR